jgi:lysophospholipase L1-like esterase
VTNRLRHQRSLLLIALTLLVLGGGAGWWARRGERAAAAPATYVALGASDAVGTGAARPAQEGWAPLVHAGLPAGARFVNLGVGGATLGDVLRGQLPVALDADPRWVTIWPGPNDLRNGVPLATFAAQLDTLLGRLRGADGEATIVVVNLPDLRSVPAYAGGLDERRREQLDARVRDWNAAIAAAAARHGAVVVDLYDKWSELAGHPEWISADGFHPSSAGYRRLAELVLAELQARP